MKVCPVCAREYPLAQASCEADGARLVDLVTGGSMRHENLVGQTVDGRWRVERVIGRGGMGVVYQCRHVVVGKAMALKALRPGTDRTEDVLARFVREAKAANQIGSRHICETVDFGQLSNGSFYAVMELLEGRDLASCMKQGLLDRKALLHVFRQVADTLDLAHTRGVVHRDLKPDNIYLVQEGGDPCFAKLLDFGIAKLAHEHGPGPLTETGVILGTPYYMSPEQARGESVDGRSDIYSLGVVMYRAFTGRLPFVGESTIGVLTRHITDVPERPSVLAPCDPFTERLILRCLEKKPVDRFQTMADVSLAIAALERELAEGVPAPESSVPTRVVRAQSGSHVALSGAHSPPTGPHAAPEAPAASGAHAVVGEATASRPAWAPASSAIAPEGRPVATTVPLGPELTGRAITSTVSPPPDSARGLKVALVVLGSLFMAILGGLVVTLASRSSPTGVASPSASQVEVREAPPAALPSASTASAPPVLSATIAPSSLPASGSASAAAPASSSAAPVAPRVAPRPVAPVATTVPTAAPTKPGGIGGELRRPDFGDD